MIYRLILKIHFILCVLFFKLIYGSRLSIGSPLKGRGFISILIEKNASLSIGDHVFFNRNCSINCLDSIQIGNYCLFGEDVRIYDHNHKYQGHDPIEEQGFNTSRIVIGDNCWIASGVTILKGVHIGANSVIGAGVVVHSDIPENSVVYTNAPNVKAS